MNRLFFALATAAFCYLLEVIRGQPGTNDTLLLVHVLFRHGHRTPGSKGYASNPIANESYYMPHGYFRLTNMGKKREYKVGYDLRQRYDGFLGPTWNINLIESRTTNFNRTKMSLELVLAGLWAPVDKQRFMLGQNWQPIPYNYLPSDKELCGTHVCSNYITLYNEVLNSKKIQNRLAVYSNIFNYLSEMTNSTIKTPDSVYNLYLDCVTQEEFGYPLEEWFAPVYPDTMQKITKDVYYIGTNTSMLKKISSGFLLKKIINDSKAKIDGLLTPSTRKMFLYSAHERNIANMLLTLGVYDDKIPTYGSYILFELHNVNKVYGFKLFYQDWIGYALKPLVIPGCKAFCPYEDYVSILKEYIPNESDCK